MSEARINPASVRPGMYVVVKKRGGPRRAVGGKVTKVRKTGQSTWTFTLRPTEGGGKVQVDVVPEDLVVRAD